jgi:long-chain acyl-CoA synthetase
MSSFWQVAAETPDHVSLVEPDGRAISAGELAAAAHRVAHGLRARGLARGDTVAAILPNGVDFLSLALAATESGLYLVPINTHLAPPEIAYIVEDSDAKVVVGPGRTSVAALAEGQPATPPADRRAGAIMTYTSGTTGRPKGVRRPLADVAPEVVAGALGQFLQLFGMGPRDGTVHLVVAPLYHTAVSSFASNHLHLGHTVVLMERWTPEGMLEAIARHRVTSTHMVPTQMRRLLALPPEARRRHDTSSLRHVIHSAAPCPPEVKRAMLEWWGPVVYEYYAASEGGGTLATPADWLAHPGTVGRAWPISRLRVVADDGRECAPGEVGTVYMSMGPHRFEYHKDRGKTESSWRGEFFTVGDAGYLSEDGFLYLCDRKSDLIISGGVNIYPAEIEAALALHPRVADVAVFGIPDDDWGEQVKAVVEPAAGAAAGAELAAELRAFLQERLASFKVPRTIDFTDALPRDPSGKLYKRKLRDPYWAGRERAI